MATAAAHSTAIGNTMAQRCLRVFERNVDGAQTLDRQTMVEVLTYVCEIDEESANLLLGFGGSFVDWHAFVQWVYGQKGARQDFLKAVEGQVLLEEQAAPRVKPRGLCFDDAAPLELDAASEATQGSARSVRGRVHTGFAFEQEEAGGTRFAAEPAEELDAASSTADSKRSLMSRSATGFEKPQAPGARFAREAPERLEAASESAGSGKKPVRGRMNTGFVHPEDGKEELQGSGLRFAENAEEAEAASTAAESSSKRAVRARINTGFVHDGGKEAESSVRTLKFDGGVEEVDAASQAIEGPKRSVRQRINTGFVSDSPPAVGFADESPPKAGLRFDAGVEELDAASEATGVPKRKARARVNTGFAFETPPETQVKIALEPEEQKNLKFAESAEELEAASSAADGVKRSVRARVNTGFVQDTPKPTAQISSAEPQVVEAASEAGPGNARGVRSRIATGFAFEEKEEEPTLERNTSLRFNTEAQELEAASQAADGPRRCVRARVNTGFAFEGPASSGAQGGGLRFQDAAEELEAASESADGPKRSTRARVNTGFAFEPQDASPPAAQLRFSETPEELQAASVASEGPKRAVRQRINTGFAFEPQGAEQPQEKLRFAEEAEELQAASEATSQPVRSVRARINTGFAFEQPASTDTKSGIRFNDAADEVLAASEASDKVARSVRGRVNTGFAFETEEPASEKAGPGLRFNVQAEELEAASTGADGPKRSVRARVNTGFAFEGGGTAEDESKRLQFKVEAEELDAASAATGGPARQVRQRVNTGFAHQQPTDAEEDEEVSPGSTAFSASPESVTSRKKMGVAKGPSFALGQESDDAPMPPGSAEDSYAQQKRSSLTQGERKGSKDSAEHVHWSERLVEAGDAASGEPSPRRTRSVRDRVNTGFMTDLDTAHDEDEEVEEALHQQHRTLSRSSSGLMDKERRSSLVRRRLSLNQDGRRSTRMSMKILADEKRKFQHATITAEFNLPVTGPEADIDEHIDDDYEKDLDLLNNSLRPLSLFSELPDEVLAELIEAMQVFSYEDGENVVEEGDTGGTHFFVIAEGQFDIIKGDQHLATLNKGTPFGESVLLIDGHRAATVQAKGPSKVYGLEAQDVRDAMHYNYELQYKEVMVALTQILADESCEQLSRLNAFQTHAIFQGSEVRHLETGEVVVQQGHSPTHEVFVLVQGAVVLRKGGKDVRRVKRNTMFGMQGLLFDYMPFQAVADGSTTLLVLTKSTVMEVYNKAEDVAKVLMRPLLMDKLQHLEHQHNVSEDQREDLENMYHIVKVQRSTILDDPNIKMVMGIDAGSFEVSTDKFTNDMQVLTGDTPDMVGIDHILNPDGSLDLQIRAGEDDWDTHVAVWYGADVSGAKMSDVHSDAMQKSIIQILRNIFLFKTLGQKQLETLARATHTRHYKDGEAIFNQGDKGDFFCIVGHGRVTIVRNGRYIRALSRFDYFGERALLTHEPRAASVEASGECAIWVISSEAFREAMPEAALDYLRGRIALQDSDYTFDDLIFIRMIGSGGFGSVKMVQKKGGGIADRYALKCVLKKPVVENNQTSMLINERSILTEIDHPFIVKLVQTFKNDAYVYFLLELVSGGELLEALQVLGLLNLEQAQFYSGSIVLALEHLHDRRVAYLDLKSENILIDYQGYIKLVDFGLAVKVTGARSHQIRGTPHFMTPEMILARGYDTTADLWTLGVCVYEFLVGTLPFGHDSTKKAEIFNAVLNAPLSFPEHLQEKSYGDACTSFVQALLIREPHQRLGGGIAGYSDIKAHKFFAGFDLDQLISRHVAPPYIPRAEKYAEETRPEIVRFQNQVLSKLEDNLLEKALTTGWSDPMAGWDDDFH